MSVEKPARSVNTMLNTIAHPDMQAKIKQALPPSVDIDRFTRTTLTAIQQNPDLTECESMSLYNSVVKAAQDGLLPDGREGAIVSRNEKQKDGTFVKKAGWMRMAYGVIKRLGKGDVYVDTQIVCENDTFEEVMGDDAKIVHKKPPLGQTRGKMVGVYAIAELPSGKRLREVMDMEDLERIRAASNSANGPAWTQWFDEMARKSVLHRISKRIPVQDDDLADFVNRMNEEAAPDQVAIPKAQQQQAPTQPAATRAAAAITQQASEPLVGDIMPRAEATPVAAQAASGAATGQVAGAKDKDVF